MFVVITSFLAGAVLLTLIEYVHHRHGGHRGWLGISIRDLHRSHHADPLDGGISYATKVWRRAPLVALGLVLVGSPTSLVLGPKIAVWTAVGGLAAYFYSEWFHHAIHHRAPRNRFERFMWRYHYIHHFKDASKNIGF